jgi:hypothetical protein
MNVEEINFERVAELLAERESFKYGDTTSITLLKSEFGVDYDTALDIIKILDATEDN